MINMRITTGVEKEISIELFGIIGHFLSKFTEEQLAEEGTLVIRIDALEGKEIRLLTYIGEEVKKVSQNYKVTQKVKSVSVNYCDMGYAQVLCMDYEN